MVSLGRGPRTQSAPPCPPGTFPFPAVPAPRTRLPPGPSAGLTSDAAPVPPPLETPVGLSTSPPGCHPYGWAPCAPQPVPPVNPDTRSCLGAQGSVSSPRWPRSWCAPALPHCWAPADAGWGQMLYPPPPAQAQQRPRPDATTPFLQGVKQWSPCSSGPTVMGSWARRRPPCLISIQCCGLSRRTCRLCAVGRFWPWPWTGRRYQALPSPPGTGQAGLGEQCFRGGPPGRNGDTAFLLGPKGRGSRARPS